MDRARRVPTPSPARAGDRRAVLQLARALLELQVKQLAVGLVDRFGQLVVVEGACFIGQLVEPLASALECERSRRIGFCLALLFPALVLGRK